MESEQREEPDDDPAPLPAPPPGWQQHRVDERRNPWATAGNVFGVILVAIMIIFGLAVAGVVVLVYIGMSHYGSNK